MIIVSTATPYPTGPESWDDEPELAPRTLWQWAWAVLTWMAA